MNPFDFVRAENGGSLGPLLIFVLWIVFSMISASKQKKKKRQLQEERERAIRGRSESSPSLEEERSEPNYSPFDLEGTGLPSGMVFDEEEEGVSMEEEPPRIETAEMASPELPFVRPPEANLQAPLHSYLHAYEQTVEKEGDVSVVIDSREDARRGFLWAEILAAPKALREE